MNDIEGVLNSKPVVSSKERLAYVFVILTSLLWGSSATVGKIVLKDLNNFQVLFYISFIAFISLFIISWKRKRLNEVRHYTKKDYFNFAYMGFLGVFLYDIFFYGALMYAPAQEVFIVNYTWPVWVGIFSCVLLKEKFSLKKGIAIGMGFLGIYLVVSRGKMGISIQAENIKGYVMALMGAVCYGVFSVLGKKHNYDKFLSMMFYYAFTFIYISIYLWIFYYIPAINFKELLGLIWIGAFSGGIASVFWFLALKYGDTFKMSNMIFLTPFISLIYTHFILDERIYVSSFIGLLFITSGILVEKLVTKG
ncbi:DMT family transporter [Clostridium peptidivorans]|uniref:DMT family transporter n=1 Tax=Clostridium peptidivorans TaxID=100174 RepID=UPI000BE2D4C2|nr:DMT family transporter [Clostridium peptidivorans]